MWCLLRALKGWGRRRFSRSFSKRGWRSEDHICQRLGHWRRWNRLLHRQQFQVPSQVKIHNASHLSDLMSPLCFVHLMFWTREETWWICRIVSIFQERHRVWRAREKCKVYCWGMTFLRLRLLHPGVGVCSKFFHSILEAEETGRFLKYDPKTKETTVLVKKLRFPNGVTFSKDKSFIIIAETRLGRWDLQTVTAIPRWCFSL